MAKYEYDEPGAFLKTIRKLLDEDPRDYVFLASDIRVPAVWLMKIMNGEIKNPGLNRMEYVYGQLTGKKLPTK